MNKHIGTPSGWEEMAAWVSVNGRNLLSDATWTDFRWNLLIENPFLSYRYDWRVED